MKILTDSQREVIRARKDAREVYWGVFDRENHECRECGADSPLEVHHKDGDPYNNGFWNLAALCHWCHRDVHRRWNTNDRLDEMEREFESMVAGRGGDFTNFSVVYDRPKWSERTAVATDGGERT